MSSNAQQLFAFHLPEALIAQRPAHPRDHARLLAYSRADKSIQDLHFYDLPNILPAATTLVLNEAKVDKCRLGFSNYELFLLKTVNNHTAEAMVRPGKKFKLGQTVELDENITVSVGHINEYGHRTLTFNVSLDDPILDKYKLTPLPPYIAQDESLSGEYQTVYAKQEGSKAAPTAGLHFTPQLLEKVSAQHPIVKVALNVGLGTFAPLTAEQIQAKKLHSESYSISRQAAEAINQASHITAVGTTTTRLLESAYNDFGGVKPVDFAETSIFIQPGDQLHVVNSLITNFHLPGTSLLMLVAAFTGEAELKRIYEHAIKQKYRFYSFGDAMIIL